jgi:hypothetical protein
VMKSSDAKGNVALASGDLASLPPKREKKKKKGPLDYRASRAGLARFAPGGCLRPPARARADPAHFPERGRCQAPERRMPERRLLEPRTPGRCSERATSNSQRAMTLKLSRCPGRTLRTELGR